MYTDFHHGVVTMCKHYFPNMPEVSPKINYNAVLLQFVFRHNFKFKVKVETFSIQGALQD